MKTMLLVLILSIFSVTNLISQDLVLVANKLKIDAYSATNNQYLGNFADLKEYLKPTCMTIAKDGKLLVAGTALPHLQDKNILVRLNKDGSFDKVLYKQVVFNSPINIPKAIVELENGSFVLFDHGNKEIFKISSTGELDGPFIPADQLKPVKSKINNILEYNGNIVVLSTDMEYKFTEYDASGNYVTNLSQGNDAINTPYHAYKTETGYIMVALAKVKLSADAEAQKVKTLVYLDNDLIFLKNLINPKDLSENKLMKPVRAIQYGANYLIIDEGRSRGATNSYDDNLELFSSDGKYQKSLGTYEDTLLRDAIIYKQSTKSWK